MSGANLQGEERVDPLQGDRAVDVEKSTASMVEACAPAGTVAMTYRWSGIVPVVSAEA